MAVAATTIGQATGAIHGNVYRQDAGETVPQADIFLLDPNSFNIIYSVQSDNTGFYQFTAPVGNYLLYASKFFPGGAFLIGFSRDNYSSRKSSYQSEHSNGLD